MKGVRALDMKSPSGVDITILIDRGMDISNFFYRSIPINWVSSTNIVAPEYYNSKGFEWLRTFYGGLLTTCGLSNIGDPCIDQGEELGLHGRISTTPAENISFDTDLQGNDLIIYFQGRIREAVLKGCKLELTRKITTYSSSPIVTIEDSVENFGFTPVPLMLLYHINIGFPLLDRTSYLISGKIKTTPKDEISEKGLKEYSRFTDPETDYEDEVFLHEIESDKEGYSNIVFVNPELNDSKGLGLWLRFNRDNLPYLIQWKHLTKGEYVCGIEPANSFIRGRAVEREKGNLQYIKPGEKKHYRLELKILDSISEIEKVKNKIL